MLGNMDIPNPEKVNSVARPMAWYRLLYVQVLIAVAAGILLGHFWPGLGEKLKPLGDGFVKLVKMVIAPIVFCTVVHGIASMNDLKRLGRVGLRTLLYFEVVSTIALAVGLLVVNLFQPGVGFQAPEVAQHVSQAKEHVEKAAGAQAGSFLLGIIPDSFVGAFAGGELLQVLLVSLVSAFALGRMGERGMPILRGIDRAQEFFFAVLGLVVKLAPVGAFGAMAFTVGKYGIQALENLLGLMVCFYLTAGLFVGGVLGLIARLAGFSMVKYLYHIRDELILTLGTSSSETALPGLMAKSRSLGCHPSTVGLVVPTGYSFNMDGTNIYLCMAAIFLAQATNTPMTWGQQLGLLFVAMLTSKGASGVTGSGFVTLAATLQAVPAISPESVAYLIGIDRFMSECRALTNMIGNGVATVVVSRWEGEVSAEEVRKRLG
jgi:aerobic C4-dicarboxylate transport protein